MRISTWLSIVAVSSLVRSAHSQADLKAVNATAIVNSAGHLYVAKRSGGIGVFDAATGSFEREIATEREVQVLKVIDGRLCWVLKDSKSVTMVELNGLGTRTAEVQTLFMHGTIRRLSGWMGQIIASGETEFVFIDPRTGLVSRAEDVLPRDVSRIAVQGMVDSFWSSGKGIFLSVRRYGQHRTARWADDIKEIGEFTAWTASEDGAMQLLGAYTASLVDFQTAIGPNVEIKKRFQTTTLPFGVGDMRNIRIGEEGIVAAGNREAFTVPFLKSNWMPNRTPTAFWPHYAKTMDYSQNTMWWSEGGRVFTTDLEDGSSTAMISKSASGDIRAIAADADGAWVATSNGVRRIDLDNLSAEWISVRADAADQASTHEQYQLLKNCEAIRSASRPSFVAEEEVRNILRKSGATIGASVSDAGQAVEEAELGDLVISGRSVGIYMGRGEVLSTDNDGWTRRQLNVDAHPMFRRVLPRTPATYADLNPPIEIASKPRRGITPVRISPPVSTHRAFEPEYAGPTANEGEMFPRGLGHAKASLGHTLFVRCAPGEAFDSPYLPSHRRLLEVAKSWVGVTYRWGGNTKEGVDCSGFVTAVYRELGVRLPRHSQDIGRCRRGIVVTDKLHFGDVLVFQSPKHVALYIGNGRTIEAISGGVTVSYVKRHGQAIVRRFLF